MSREYGRISTKFWSSRDIRELSDKARLLASYLLTSPHSNSIGAYLLPDAYVADDLGWSSDAVSKAFQELFENGFAKRFRDGRHICVVHFLDFNPIENPNVGKAVIKAIEQLPDDPALLHVFNGLEQYSRHFGNTLETVRQQFRNIEPNLSEPNQTELLTTPAEVVPASKPKRKSTGSSSPRFEEFWSACPKKTGKGPAEKAFSKAVLLAEPDTLIAAMTIYAGTQVGKDKAYIKTPGPWLNEKRWLDEGIAPAAPPSEATVEVAKSAWGGRAAPLIDEIGVPMFAAWFDGTEFEDGPPARISFPKAFKKSWVAQHYDAQLRRAYGDISLEVAA